MKRYFISDLHLSPETPLLATALVEFLQGPAADADELYILGDFFNAWIGDDEDEPFYLELKTQLKHYADTAALYFMRGNRDFLVGDRFAKDCNLKLLGDEHLLDLGGHRTLLMHGDQLCTGDRDYMAFRSQVRNPEWQRQILALPLAQRRIMAQQLRQQSASMNSNKAEDIMDVDPATVESLFQHQQLDLLIHGHTHRPQRHSHGSSERIVLGDWGANGWYLSADGDNLDLVSFPIPG